MILFLLGVFAQINKTFVAPPLVAIDERLSIIGTRSALYAPISSSDAIKPTTRSESAIRNLAVERFKQWRQGNTQARFFSFHLLLTARRGHKPNPVTLLLFHLLTPFSPSKQTPQPPP